MKLGIDIVSKRRAWRRSFPARDCRRAAVTRCASEGRTQPWPRLRSASLGIIRESDVPFVRVATVSGPWLLHLFRGLASAATTIIDRKIPSNRPPLRCWLVVLLTAVALTPPAYGTQHNDQLLQEAVSEYQAALDSTDRDERLQRFHRPAHL